MLKMYKCGYRLVASDGTGRYSPKLDDGPTDAWRTPEVFMMMNAQGMVVWSDDPAVAALKAEAECEKLIAGGTLLWKVNDTPSEWSDA